MGYRFVSLKRALAIAGRADLHGIKLHPPAPASDTPAENAYCPTCGEEVNADMRTWRCHWGHLTWPLRGAR